MTDEWDFYFMNVDDKVGAFFVDLGAHATVPRLDLPFLAYVRLSMNSPRADGLSSNDEFDTLIAIEDAMKQWLIRRDTDYVGRCTTAGCRDFFFYTASPHDWPGRVANVLQAFPDYRSDAGVREEPDWSTYLEYLSDPGRSANHRQPERLRCLGRQRRSAEGCPTYRPLGIFRD